MGAKEYNDIRDRMGKILSDIEDNCEEEEESQKSKTKTDGDIEKNKNSSLDGRNGGIAGGTGSNFLPNLSKA